LLAVATPLIPAAATVDPVASGPPGCAVDTSNVIGWWAGEDTLTAEVGPDLSGTSGFAPGYVGRAMAFSPSSLVSTDALATVSNAVSVEAWVKPVSTGQVQSLFSRWTWVGGDNDDSYALFLGVNDDLFWITDETSTRSPVSLSAPVPQIYDGQFHHVAATWNATEMSVYLDGQLVGTRPSQGGVLNPGPTTPFRLGSSAGPGSPLAYTGILDEPTVYDRALSGAEIQGIAAAGPDAKCEWTQKAELTPAGSVANDYAGYRVAVDGNTAVVGSFAFGGSAYVFTRTGSTWSQQAKLTTPDGALDDFFGSAVAVSGDTIVIGSYFNDTIGNDAGAAYVFTRTGTLWTLQSKLTGGATGAEGDLFGWSVGIDGNTAVIGAYGSDDAGLDSGSAFVFTRTGSTWTQQSELVATDGVAGDSMGFSVAVSVDTVVTGARRDNSDAGSAYVFTRTGSSWTQQAKLTAADQASGDSFGAAVAVRADTVVAGAYGDDLASGVDAGSAYVFVRSGAAWSQQAKLVAADAAAGDNFGWAVAVSGNNAMVGSLSDDLAAGVDAGSAHVFNRTGLTWLPRAELVANDAAAGDFFGHSVGLSGNTAIVGAPFATGAAPASGSAYIFTR